MYHDRSKFVRGPDAVCIGWQIDCFGEPLALYNITVEGHPSNGSTVTADYLQELNLRIPATTV